MSSRQLNQAVQLVEEGQYEQARIILQGLIRANRQDLAAWSWYVKSFHTSQKRLQLLEECLKFNPGNIQVLDAIGKLRGKLLDETEPAFEHIYVSKDMLVPADAASPRALIVNPDDDSDLVIENEPIKVIRLDETPQRAYFWYDVWWMAIKNPNQNVYNALLQDPLASVSRAYWWMFVAGMVNEVTSLLALYLDPRYQPLFIFFDSIKNIRNGSAILVLSTIILLIIGAGVGVLINMSIAVIYNLLAKASGGTQDGDFARTFYLMAAYGAPVSIVTGILSMIPCLNLIALVIRFYSFRYNVLALQAVYQLNRERAVLVVVISVLIILFLAVLFLLGPTVGLLAYMSNIVIGSY